jgi:hypothetical protein
MADRISEISIAECYKVWNIIKQTNKDNKNEKS